MNDEQQQFLDQILADPDNDEPRLVYADWLADRGDPRGEFIQLQVAREHLPEFSSEALIMRRRELELLREYGAQWAGDLENLLYRYVYRRGFIEWGRVNTERFVETAPQIFRLAPLQHLMLARGTIDERLADCAELQHLKSICFSKCGGGHDLLAVVSSPHMSNVRGLGFAELDTVPLRRIAATKPLLESLYVTQSGIRGWNAWLEGAKLPPLRSLRVKGAQLHDQIPSALRHVCESPLRDSLEEFGFCEWDARCTELHRLTSWQRLRKLEISMPTAASIMQPGEGTTRLDALSIESYMHREISMQPQLFRVLLNSPMLSNLHLLRIHGSIDDFLAKELAEWSRLPALSRLNLSSNTMRADGIRFLLKAIPEDRRPFCDFRQNSTREEGIHQLAKEFGSHLKRCLTGPGGWYLGDTQGRDWSGENLTLV